MTPPKGPEVDDEIRRMIRAGAKHRAIADATGASVGYISKVRNSTPIEEGPVAPVARDPISEPEDWVYADGYTFNGHTDTYVTYLKSAKKNVVVTGENHRAMKASYSNWDGNPQSLNQVCRRFGVARKWFHEYKTVHGWTHDSDPFSAEEMQARTVDDLSKDALEQKRQAVFQETERLKWRETQQNADKWANLERNLILPLQELIRSSSAKTTERLNIVRAKRPFALVTGTGELHYGKAGWAMEVGDECNRETAAARIRQSVSEMLSEVSLRGRPEEIILAFGDDFLNIDTPGSTTTRGTLQDIDGTVARALYEGFEIVSEVVEAMASVARVVVKSSLGNHSRLLEFAMMMMLRERMAPRKDIRVDVTPQFRSYHRYGATLCGWHHGDILKPKDAVQVMAVEARALWSETRYRAIFTGHYHDREVTKLIGATMYQSPSLAGMDRYHKENGFFAIPGLAGYLIDKERGVTTTIFCPVA